MLCVPHVKEHERLRWYVPLVVVGVQIVLSFLMWRFGAHVFCLP